MSQGLFNIIFYGSLIFIGIMFVFVIVMMISPKARAKWMGKQIQATKYMVDDQKENIRDISTNMADASKEGVKKLRVHALLRHVHLHHAHARVRLLACLRRLLPL